MEAFVEASVIVYSGDCSATALLPVIIKGREESELYSRHAGATALLTQLYFKYRPFHIHCSPVYKDVFLKCASNNLIYNMDICESYLNL